MNSLNQYAKRPSKGRNFWNCAAFGQGGDAAGLHYTTLWSWAGRTGLHPFQRGRYFFFSITGGVKEERFLRRCFNITLPEASVFLCSTTCQTHVIGHLNLQLWLRRVQCSAIQLCSAPSTQVCIRLSLGCSGMAPHKPWRWGASNLTAILGTCPRHHLMLILYN